MPQKQLKESKAVQVFSLENIDPALLQIINFKIQLK
jgi:hypothetical protein